VRNSRRASELINRDTSETRTTTSGAGRAVYALFAATGFVPTGIAASGFATIRGKFSLNVNQEVRVDAQLQIATITDPYDIKYMISNVGELKKDRRAEHRRLKTVRSKGSVGRPKLL